MSDSRWLILETSGPLGRVGLALGETICRLCTLEAARRHARDLAPTVAGMLAQQQWQPRDLTGVIVSRGPGSYTGLRVGVMSAKAFAFAMGCALIAVDTFAAVAYQAPVDVNQLDVIGDAQQDKLYIQPFARTDKAEMQAVRPLAIMRVGDWLASRDASSWISGPGLQRFRNHLPAGCRIVETQFWDPSVDALLRLGLARYERGERDDAYRLEPLYLRPSAAEEQRQRE